MMKIILSSGVQVVMPRANYREGKDFYTNQSKGEWLGTLNDSGTFTSTGYDNYLVYPNGQDPGGESSVLTNVLKLLDDVKTFSWQDKDLLRKLKKKMVRYRANIGKFV